MLYQGDYAEDATVYVMFNTFDSNDPSASVTITNFINTDVHVHKDNGLTQRNNAAGITVSVNFDGITGSHMIAIDTSDETVAAFWVTGSDYFVRIEGTTVDAGTINAVVGHFSIENRFNEVDLTHVMGTILTEGGAGRLAAAITKLFDVATPLLVASDVMVGTDSAALAATALSTAVWTAARAGALTDWIEGGRLDNLLDAIPTTAMRGTDSAALAATALSTAQWTAARAGYLDELAAANLPSDVDTILTRLSAARAGYLDELNAPNIPADIDTLLARITAAVALASVCTEGRLAELDGANMPADIDAIPTTAMRGTDSAALAGTALSTAQWTAARAGYLDELAAANLPADIDTLLTRVTAAVATATALATAQTDLDTLTDPTALPGQEAPTATPTLVEAAVYLFKQMTNKETQTATEYKLFARDEVTIDQKATVSDDATTYTKGEVGTGA